MVIDIVVSPMYRGYSKATAGGGAIVDSTKGGGGTTRSTSSGGSSSQTSSSGGGTSRSTSSGGGSSQTSAAGGDHTHLMFTDTGETGQSATARWYRHRDTSAAVIIQSSRGGDMYTAGSSGNHTHSVNIPAHSHEFSTPNHTHTVNIPAHTHDVTIPSHTHEIELPNHTHDVRHEIVELDRLPTKVSIKVDGNTVPHTALKADRLDIVDYLEKDSNGKIKRGRHVIEILPNDLARIEAFLVMRVFVQSSLGGQY